MTTSHQSHLGRFERLTAYQVGIFLTATAWAFGGNADWVKPYLALWGSLSVLITLSALMAGTERAPMSRPALLWLWPFGLFNGLVLVSILTPGLREAFAGASSVYVPVPTPLWKPSAALPRDALRALWLFDGIYLSCFNLALLVHHRRVIRALLLFVVANAFVLAVFGTVQKLTHAPGLYFGLVHSPQVYFFASFIYHNHWGAFIILMSALCLGLVNHYARRHEGRDFFHTPAFGGLLVLLVMAATVPLSTSRSCSLLLVVLLAVAFVHWLRRILRQRRQYNESARGVLLAAILAIAAGGAGIWYLAQDTIVKRVAKTEQQLADIRARGEIGRAILYRDTWRMAKDKIWFGWGMASYPQVFWIYNTQEPNPLDNLPVYYHDAHNDWFQSLAEHGIIGTLALGLCGLVPLFLGLRGRSWRSPLTLYPFIGCALILAYAWLEFPFGNVAVVLAWWLSFFAGLRYARLGSSHRANRAGGAASADDEIRSS